MRMRKTAAKQDERKTCPLDQGDKAEFKGRTKHQIPNTKQTVERRKLQQNYLSHHQTLLHKPANQASNHPTTVEQNQEAPGGNATVGVTLQLANGSSYSQSSDLSCWFQLRNVSGYAHDAVGSNSKSWNYIHTERSGGPATLAISTSSSTASSSTATGTLTTSTSSSATATTTAASASSDKSNVSAAPDGAAQTSATSSASSANTTATASTSSKGISGTVGVAIGVSIGALAVIIPLGIWAFVHRRRRQRQLAGGRRHRLEFDGGDDGVSPGTGRRHYPSVNPNVVEAAGPGLGNDNSEMYSYYAYKEHAPLTSPTATTARSPVSTVLYPGSAVGEGKAAEMAHPSNEVYELYGTNETRQV
ncbi:hypothetical protein BD289DRAFT_141482 [Coniella lustricola]|uniref:Mid2 domain-containing protein n=1 Tax=Coniella lustricola TaxID=2025994 RepID=A0A2T3AFA3_9PEZI|nr:hypothetical protein BD289DRAFT_141482 [Coniella lustricola]